MSRIQNKYRTLKLPEKVHFHLKKKKQVEKASFYGYQDTLESMWASQKPKRLLTTIFNSCLEAGFPCSHSIRKMKLIYAHV